MESSALLRSFHCSVTNVSTVASLLERPGIISGKLSIGGKLVSSSLNRRGTVVKCLKTPETTVAKSEDSSLHSASEKSTPWRATFPTGFEALVLEVCDETEIAELKLKVGDFQMHLKRKVGAAVPPAPIVSPAPAPIVPTKPSIASSAPAAPPSAPTKSFSEKSTPFINLASEKSSKLDALQASGATGYVIVSSTTVGSFRKGRTVKGKKQPPISKEGGVIKEGQVIGYVDQFGSELPVKSDASGEILKLLVNEGEAIGYGDPLMAILPSFRGIK